MNWLRKDFLLLLTVTAFALFIRVYQLDLNKPNLYSDEADLHYKTNAWVKEPNRPLFDYFFYGTYTYTWFLGLNPLGVRFPSAVYMTISVALMFYFAKALAKELGWGEKTLPLLAALLTAVLPWSFMLSRIGFSHISLLMVFLLIYFILYVRAKNFRDYILTLIPLLLGVYYYQPVIVVAPFALAVTALELRKISVGREFKRFLFVSGFFLAVTAVIFLFRPNYSNVSVGARGLDLALWRDVNVTAENNLYRGLSRLSGSPESLGDKLNYNFPLSVAGNFWKNYLSFFSPDFLFLKGSPVLRHSTGQAGNFFLFLAPLMVYGAYFFLRKGNTKLNRFFLVWILMTPVATSLTDDGFAASSRVTAMMPFLTFFSAVGMSGAVRVIRWSWGRIVMWLVVAPLLIFSTFNFLYGYFQVYPALAAKDFEYGFKELSDFQIDHENQVMLVIWDGYYPHYNFRFWQNIPYRNTADFIPKTSQINQSVFNQMTNGLFFSLPKTSDDAEKFIKESRVKFVALPNSLSKKGYGQLLADYQVVQTVDYPDQTPAFYILETR